MDTHLRPYANFQEPILLLDFIFRAQLWQDMPQPAFPIHIKTHYCYSHHHEDVLGLGLALIISIAMKIIVVHITTTILTITQAVVIATSFKVQSLET